MDKKKQRHTHALSLSHTHTYTQEMLLNLTKKEMNTAMLIN